MAYILDAACACHVGRLRKTNEDNFYFDGRCLEENNLGLKQPVVMRKALRGDLIVAVMDGMGGENFGECASFAAAESLKKAEERLKGFFVPEKRFLGETAQMLNEAVVSKARELLTTHMGSTLALLCFTRSQVYSCNLGDSRAYRLRAGEFLQLTEDHVESRINAGEKKPRLTQYLGIDPEEVLIEPHIAKGDLRRGDQYLLCSDGLTDMLGNAEIAAILQEEESAENCAQKLIDAALEKGGKDNVTVIVCRIR